MNMINVLINAYACSPNWGSEPGMGWHWVSNLAKYCNLYIITEGEWKEEIEEAVRKHPFKEHLHFYYNPVPERVRKMCWNQGDWRFYWHYRKWQSKTLEIAKQICLEHRIDVIHQLNMIGFREPGLLWKIDGPKHIWGPIGSMGDIPTQLLKDLPLKMLMKQKVKNLISHYQIRHSPVKDAIVRSDRLIAALNVTADTISKVYGRSVEVIGETGLEPNESLSRTFNSNKPLELLWVGRFIPTKKLSIALEALARTKNYKAYRLHIVGTGTNEEIAMYHDLANKFGISDVCIWYGKISHHKVQEMMREKDLFYFTSIYEGGPHVINEAISNNLPILCFDTCGQGTVVDETIGWKIPMTTIEEGINGFAEKLDYIIEHREALIPLSLNCKAKQRELSWERKIKRICEIYEEAINERKTSM